MKRQRTVNRTALGRIAFNSPWDTTPISPDELEEWELTFDEDMTPDEDE